MVVEDTGFSAYMVRRYGKPDSALRKFMTEDLYMIPPAILPCKHFDTPDMRYLDSNFFPIKHPFDNTADIECHTTSWFKDQPPGRVPTFIQDNVIPSILSVQAKPLYDMFMWDDNTISWVDTRPVPFPPRPPSQVSPPHSII